MEAKLSLKDKEFFKLKTQLENNKKTYELQEEELKVQVRGLELQVKTTLSSTMSRGRLSTPSRCLDVTPKRKTKKLQKFLSSAQTLTTKNPDLSQIKKTMQCL